MAKTVDNLIDIPSLAALLRVTERFTRWLVHERRVPFHKIGKFVRIHRDDVEQWVSNQRVRTAKSDFQHRQEG